MQKVKAYSIFRFIVEVFLWTIIIRVLIVGMSYLLYDAYGMEYVSYEVSIMQQSFLYSFIMGCLLVPFVESITAQALPITVLSYWIKSNNINIVISALLFSFFHASQPLEIIIGMFLLGLILAWAFVAKRHLGFIEAVLIITAIHGLFNLVSFLYHQLLMVSAATSF